MKKHMFMIWISVSCLAAGSPVWAELPEPATSESTSAAGDPAFIELRAKILRDGSAAGEQDMLALLRMGERLGVPVEASITLRNYLMSHAIRSPELMSVAAENALLCGDLKTGVGRYKQYIDMMKDKPSTPQISKAATDLYRLQIDFMGDYNGALRLINTDAAPFRQSSFMPKFDAWFLNIALERARQENRAPTEAADHLVRVFKGQLPLEQERYYFWSYLDEIMDVIYGADRQNNYQPLPAYRALVPLIREDALRSARYGFYVAYLDFLAGSQGKELASLEREYETVINSAKAYMDAFPCEATLTNIQWVLSSRYRDWTAYASQRKQFFVYAAGKLPPAERQNLLNWQYRLSAADPLTWMEIGVRHPKDIATSQGVRSLALGSGLPWDTDPAKGINKPEHYRKMLPYLDGVRSEAAAEIRALAAAGSDDAFRGMQSLLKTDSWFLGFTAYYDCFQNCLWPSFNRMPRAETNQLPASELGRTFVAFGMEAARTPIVLFDSRVARDTVSYMVEDGDKAALPKVIDALAWVPWDAETRKAVFNPGLTLLQKWAKAQSALKPEQRTVPTAQIAEWEKALRAALTSAASAPAPTPLCAALARLSTAENAANQDAFIKASKEVYDLSAKWNETRAPFALPALRYALTSRVKDLDNLDFQCSVLRQCLAEYTASPAAAERADLVFSLIQDKRNRWSDYPALADRDKLRKVNGIIEQALLDQLAKDQFSPELYRWFNLLRGGANNDWDFGTNLVDRLVEKKTIGKIPNLPGAADLMTLVSKACPVDYAKKYPADSYFEEMAAADMARDGTLFGGWDYYAAGGRDIKGSLGSVAAKQLLAYDVFPLGYGDVKMPCQQDKIWYWYNKALSAPTDKDAIEALSKKAGTLYGTRRFDPLAMQSGLPPYGSYTNPAGRKAYFEHTTPAYLDRLAATPARLTLNWSFSPLSDNPATPLSDEEITLLVRLFKEYMPPQNNRAYGTVRWDGDWGLERVIPTLCKELAERGRQAELFAILPHVWKFAGDRGNVQLMGQLTAFARELSDKEQHGLALAFSMAGIQTLEGNITADQKDILNIVMSKSRRVLFRDMILVPASDPRYPIFKAQAEWYSGSPDTAWRFYLEKQELVPAMLQDLDPEFLIWLIRNNTVSENFEQAETLSKHMMQWADTSQVAVDPQIRANLMLAYAQIAFTRREYPQARAQLQRIITGRDFESTRAATDARVQVADIDRLTKNFDSAVALCEDIKRNGDPYAVKQSDFVMAKVKFDQEDYSAARDVLTDLIGRDPDFNDAKILNGKVLLKIRRFQDASDLEIGPSAQRRIIVPGRPLKVSLYDKNAEFSSGVGAIELRLWTDSGDEEFFKLLPHGDIKRRYVAEIASDLGPVQKGDQKLQVVGSDHVHYDFSERFKQLHNVTNAQPHFLTIASDGELSASSGKILTRREQEQIRLARLVGLDRLVSGKTDQLDAVKLSEVRDADQIKPGNKINVRVLDPDRSLTAQKDTLDVSVLSSSGDSVPRMMLEETDTHSGVFEGHVQTAPGQPTAFASDSAENRNPNFAISFKDYPAWMGAPETEGNARMRVFTVDLNDNVPLGDMQITSKEPNRRLKRFFVQTSLQRDRWVTCGVWPGEWQAWDGALQIRLMRKQEDEEHSSKQKTELDSVESMLAYLDRLGGQDQTPCLVLTNVTQATLALDQGAAPYAQALGMTVATNEFIIHLRGAFYMPVRKVRTFSVQRSDTKVLSEEEKQDKTNKRQEPKYLFTIDGKTTRAVKNQALQELGPLTIRRALAKGVHQLDVFVLASRDEKVAFDVQMDLNGTGMVSCAAGMFDPVQEPRIKQAVYVPPVSVVTNADATTFDLRFNGVNARAFRLALMDYEADAPAINKILLRNQKGDRVLPTKYDFMDLRKNDVLEVLPGDKVTVSYKDPVSVTPGLPTQSVILNVTYTDAQISACFVEYVPRPGGVSEPVYIPMLRFLRNDPVTVFINDPDMDVSDKKDMVKFEVKNIRGVTITGDAIETKENSGVFIGRILPVTAEPKRPFEIQCQEDDTLTLTYLDVENLDPGVPWPRVVKIDSAFYVDPEVRAYDVSSAKITNMAEGVANEIRSETVTGMETYWVSRALTCWRLPDRLPARIVQAVAETNAPAVAPEQAVVLPTNLPTYYQGGPLAMEVIWPTVVLSPLSKLRMFAQTSSGRARFGQPLKDDEFDMAVPGTIMLEGSVGLVGKAEQAPQYTLDMQGDPYAAESAAEDGRFTFCLPVGLGPLPAKSLLEYDDTGAIKSPPNNQENKLIVNGNDMIFMAFEYADKQGVTNRVVQRFGVKSDGFLDMLDRNAEKKIEAVYVGEKIYFRVVDQGRDLSDEKDRVTLLLNTTSGHVVTNQLVETMEHTGEFVGFAKAVSVDELALVSNAFDAVPCVYGDDVVATYRATSGEEITGKVYIYKGADGIVQLFTKRFKDTDIAVKTQFAMAEAYFELAKKHRRLKQSEVARREIKQGKKLLEEALRDFPDAGARDQAEYLLANLSLEFAEETTDAREKERLLTEAVNRFADIVGAYMDSQYAPKSQYKKALCYEKLGQMDMACEEYVKLAYTYPDHELIAETIARLGQYFWNKAKDAKKKADELKAGGKDEQILAAEVEYQQSRQIYATAGEVFGRLSVRFPNHKLAGQTKALSGQAFLQARDYNKAIETFTAAMDQFKEDKVLIPEVAYWTGHCYFLMDRMDKAYQTWKKLTWDYPESKWAKYARGRLTEPSMVSMGNTLEAAH